MSTDQQTAPVTADAGDDRIASRPATDVNAWRGVAPEDDAERTAAEFGGAKAALRLRAESRALLGSLLRPHRGARRPPRRCCWCRTPPRWPGRTW